MAKFAPGCVAHPAAAWVPWLERKYLTAVQRDMQGNSLWTTGMTTARQIPSSACSFAQYELYVLTGILCYSREKSRDPHSLSAIWRRKLIRPPLCQVFPFSLTFLSQFDYFTWGCFSWWFYYFFLSYCFRGSALRLQNFPINDHHLCQSYLGCYHFAFRGLSHYMFTYIPVQQDLLDLSWSLSETLVLWYRQ